MKRVPPACVLTIAGSDSGAGAGVQADARTIHALGGFACTAITAITAQNTRGVQRWEPVAPRMIAAQITTVLSDGVGRGLRTPRSRKQGPLASNPAVRGRGIGPTLSILSRTAEYGLPGVGLAKEGISARQRSGALPVRAIKTGLIPSAAAVRAVAHAVKGHPAIPLVVDPVIGSTSGTLFLDDAGMRALKRELLPLATLVTPNWPEAEALTGTHLHSFADAERVARAIVRECHCAVLLKGGHAPGDVCRDCLVTADGQVHWFEAPRIITPNTHGTGCVLSAAIATGLARGESLERAVNLARRFLQRSLRRHRRQAWGGSGPAYPGK